MRCDVSEEQLRQWLARDAPELERHVPFCLRCSALVGGLRARGVSSPSAGAELPDRIDSYRITGLLGRGGQAIVYEAEQQTPRRSVALKVLRAGPLARTREVEQFRRETRILASLKHPSIATVYEAGRTGEGQHFLAMELARGRPLDRYVRDEALSREERLELFHRICEAVQYAHEHGVVHRDLKPSNILVDEEGDPKILDFGLARITDEDVTLVGEVSGTGQVLGTLGYMSPEQVRGQVHRIDRRSDVYSLGVILFELLTDRSPYGPSGFTHETLAAICDEAPRKPSRIDRTVPRELDTIVLRALEKQPQDRCRSAAALGGDIRRHLEGEPILARRPGFVYVLRKRMRKHPVAFGFAGAVLLLSVLGLLAWTGWKQRELERVRGSILSIQRDSELGRAQEMIGTAENLYRDHPELPEAYLVREQARFRVGRQLGDQNLIQGVLADMRFRLSQDPGQWSTRALLAEILRILGDREAGERERIRASRDRPDSAETWYLGSFTTLDVDEATRCLEEFILRGPTPRLARPARMRLAQLYVWRGRSDDALRVVQEVYASGGESPEWLLFEGRALMAQGRLAEAEGRFRRAMDLAPEGHWPHHALAVLHVCTERHDRAIEEYTTALAKHPRGLIWDRFQRATPLWIRDRLEEAASDYRAYTAARGDASFGGARLYLVLLDQARRLDDGGREDEAGRIREEAERVLEAGRRSVVPGHWLESVLGCLAGRLAPGDLVAAADPHDPREICEAYYYAGEVDRSGGRTDEARKWFQACVNTGLMLDPTSGNVDAMSEYHLARWRLVQLGG